MNRLPDSHFARQYADSPDPWGFENRWYERRKRALTVAMLPRARFRRAFEPGCSIGTLSAELAPFCDSLLATDVVEAPLEAARRRLDGIPTCAATFALWALGDEWPDDEFDLIVLSEVCYYLESADLEVAVQGAAAHLTGDGVMVAAHWRHPAPDHRMTGDEVHRILAQEPTLTRTARYADADVLIETFARTGRSVSVAQAEGLAR